MFKKIPNYGLLELGDPRVRSLKSLNKLIKKIFSNSENNNYAAHTFL